MKKFIFGLMAMVAASVMTSCELDVSLNGKDVKLSDITIECIDETIISNNTSGDVPFTKHTYLCRGYIGGFKGDCSIRVMHDNFIVYENHNLTLAREKLPFEFTFAPEWGYLDQVNLNFIIEVLDGSGKSLCSTTVVATQHPERPVTEE